jgi:hypothetical protein
MRELAELPTEAQEIIFEQSAETHATADKKHRGGRAEIGREYDRRCCADVLPRFLHSAEPQKWKAPSECKIRNLMQVVRNL